MIPIEPDHILPIALTASVACAIAWVINTWIRARHGYPLENSWGKAVYPKTGEGDGERFRRMGEENASLRAELATVKDRLATVERIVTDSGYRLTNQIEALRDPPRADIRRDAETLLENR